MIFVLLEFPNFPPPVKEEIEMKNTLRVNGGDFTKIKKNTAL